MASQIVTTRVRAAFKKVEKDPALAEIAVAVYQKALRDGLRKRVESGNFAPNSPAWKKRKKGKGPWVRTGATLKAITNNAPTKLGTKKGVKVGVNFRSAMAFAQPRSFTDGKGKRLPVALQEKVFNALKYGSVVTKIRSAFEKKGGGSLEDYVSGVTGLKKSDRERVVAGKGKMPGRPLFAWDTNWDAQMEKDIDAAIGRVLGKAGFEVTR